MGKTLSQENDACTPPLGQEHKGPASDLAINAWTAKQSKHREPERPLRLQHLRQERQADEWRIHRPGRGQAPDGGAGEEGRVNIGIHWKLAPFLERKGAAPKSFN